MTNSTQIVSTIDLASVSALESAVLISLFTDTRVTDEELPEGEDSRRGFWGDLVTGSTTGSKLWLLQRAKRTQETLRLFEDYARQALEWLRGDGHVNEISVTAVFTRDIVELTVILDGRVARYAV